MSRRGWPTISALYRRPNKVLCLSNRLDHWKDIQIVVTFLAWDFNIPSLIVGLLRFKYWAK
jgi:hypothetical protein